MKSKVGCVFPIVLLPDIRVEQYREGDHREKIPLG